MRVGGSCRWSLNWFLEGSITEGTGTEGHVVWGRREKTGGVLVGPTTGCGDSSVPWDPQDPEPRGQDGW